MIPHRLCLMVGHFNMSHHGFLTDANPNVGRHDWRVGTGTCDCECTTCQEVHGEDADGSTFYIYRYMPKGREVAKVIIVADESEGMA